VEKEDTSRKGHQKGLALVYDVGVGSQMATDNREAQGITFSHALNGYARDEVDAFVKQASAQANRQKKAMDKLKAELAALLTGSSSNTSSDALETAMRERDEYRRISERLAREVFEHKLGLGKPTTYPAAAPAPARGSIERKSSQNLTARETVAAYRSYFTRPGNKNSS